MAVSLKERNFWTLVLVRDRGNSYRILFGTLIGADPGGSNV